LHRHPNSRALCSIRMQDAALCVVWARETCETCETCRETAGAESGRRTRVSIPGRSTPSQDAAPRRPRTPHAPSQDVFTVLGHRLPSQDVRTVPGRSPPSQDATPVPGRFLAVPGRSSRPGTPATVPGRPDRPGTCFSPFRTAKPGARMRATPDGYLGVPGRPTRPGTLRAVPGHFTRPERLPNCPGTPELSRDAPTRLRTLRPSRDTRKRPGRTVTTYVLEGRPGTLTVAVPGRHISSQDARHRCQTTLGCRRSRPSGPGAS